MSIIKWVTILSLLIILFIPYQSRAEKEQRIALIIGNEMFAKSMQDLSEVQEADNKGYLERSISLLTRAISAGKLKGEDLAYALNDRGILYRRKGLYGLAIADYSQAIRVKADFLAAYSNRGLAYAKMGLYVAAIVEFTNAIKLEPFNADTYLKRGNAYFDHKSYDRAIADYSYAIELQPFLLLAHVNRRDALAIKGLLNQGIKDCGLDFQIGTNFMHGRKTFQRLDMP